MSSQQTSRDTPSTTSSQASEDGRSPSSWQGGLQMPLFGREAVPASRSATPAKAEEHQTPATSGLSSTVSLQSAALQLSLESRLRASMGGDGSPEYVLTWSQWAMPWGLPICALRASGRHTSEADSGGWPTPTAVDRTRDEETMAKSAAFRKRNANQNTVPLYLGEVAQLTGWPTPSAKQFEQDPEAWEARRQRNLAKGYNGNGQGATLDIVAQAAGWMTPTVNDATGSQYAYSSGDHDKVVLKLPGQAQAAGWGTPTSRDHKDSTGQTLPTNGLLGRQALDSGTTQSSSPVSTANRGVLNPELARWLMGFPAEWGSYAPTATPSRRKSRPGS
jgi:hypothetical protein